jgi:hypothetical protein
MKSNKVIQYNYIPGYTRCTFTAVIFFLFVVLLLFVFSVFSSAPGKNVSLIDSLNTSQSVYFDYGSSELKIESYEILDKLADELKTNLDAKLNITGHTDDRGGEIFNFELSEKRAIAVKEYLITKGCISDNIFTYAKGKSEPLNTNSNNTERALNRRVEFVLEYNTDKYKEEEKDVTYINSSLNQISRSEIKCELSVRDTSGEPVEGIKEEDLSAVLKWETDNKEDSASGSIHFIPIDDKKKLAFSLTMDYSGSMYGTDHADLNTPKSNKVIEMENAVKAFIRELKSNMFCKIIKFGFKVDEIIKYTKSTEVLETAIDKSSFPRGGTALYLSMYRCMSDTTYEKNPTIMKTVIAFTDGMENSSGKITIDSVYNLSSRKNIKIFTVGLFADIAGFAVSKEEKQKGVQDLMDIAGNCGGFFYNAANPNQLTSIYKNIFAQILKSYQVSIIWNDEKLPPKGTKVKAVIRLNISGKTRILCKDYVME